MQRVSLDESRVGVQHSLLEGQVLTLARRVRTILREQSGAVHPDLQPAPYLMLSWLVDNGPVRATRIVEAFGIDKAAVSRHLKGLDELGLLRRLLDPADRRGRLIAASDEALCRIGDPSSRGSSWLRDRLDDWSTDDVSRCLHQIARLNGSLEA